MAPTDGPVAPPFPPLPSLDSAAADDVLDGHLWVTELVDGSGIRFRMAESGLLEFAGPNGAFGDDDAVPAHLRPAVRHVRARFDRGALRDAVAEPADVAFLGVATHRRRVDYDWDRLPPFLGTDVWTDSGDRFRPPDAAAAIFEGVGLDPVTAVERELRARDFDPDAYGIPASAWYDGPAAGVVVRNKRGGRGRVDRDDIAVSDVAASDPDLDALAATHATETRLDGHRAEIERRGEPPTVDALADAVVEAVAREAPVRVRAGDGPRADDGAPDDGSRLAVDAARLRAAAVDRVRARYDPGESTPSG